MSEHTILLSAITKIKKRTRAGLRLFMAQKSKHGLADKTLVFSLNRSKIPTVRQLTYVSNFLNRRERLTIVTGLIVMAISLTALGITIYRQHTALAPARGGSYTEVLTGSPQFINPLYSSINTVDSDLTALVYSGLLKRNGDNALVPDLAESFTVSEDGRVYTFSLKQTIQWHDGRAFNANDVVFTFAALTNSTYSSPLQRSYSGITAAQIDEHTVTLTLAEPYAAFLELTTIGILPATLWQQIPPSAAHLADLNTKPIGTGPYAFQSLTKDKNGTIRSYELKANESYWPHQPYISTMIFKFSPNFQEGINALNEGRAEGIDYFPQEQATNIVAKNNYTPHYLEQPQFNALFFNQSNLGDAQDVRVKQALAHALDKQLFITDPLYTSVVNGPILPLLGDYYNPDSPRYDYDAQKAAMLLDASGWLATETPLLPESADAEAGIWRTKNDRQLELTITTVDQPETVALAEFIKTAWEALHIKVNIALVAQAQMQSDVIQPRNYQILLYGVVAGADPDQYPFWHSSQISANGLNLSNYSNKKVDALLEDARITTDPAIRKEKYYEFQNIIAADLPAIFLYSRRYVYLQTKAVKGFDVRSITVPSDRFNAIADWYLKTKKQLTWRSPS